MSRLRARPDCDACEELKQARGEEPPCEKCTPPLFPENRDVAGIYMQCANQVIIAPMGGVVDIDFEKVNVAVERSGVADKDKVFWAVVKLARHFIEEKAE